MFRDSTDEELISYIRQSNQFALEELFHRYYKCLCQLCSVYIKDDAAAEEIVSNIFIRFWENRDVVTVINIKSYFFSSAKNAALNYIQKKKAPLDYIEDYSAQAEEHAEHNTPFKILSGRESYKKILSLIDTLPPAQRQVLLMSRIDNMDKHEISNLLGITVRTVETMLYQSIKNLRRLINNPHDLTT
ncbi:RNA polymerase sigma-70 factor [Mucilaginibacter limnophilus]|uniref:RNA polymerase sigma-70 factor n=1 Tax=Mucilaginibacter limnophilus TaxID=1932778 RepID=A0A3S2UNK7_9SPHI|nr:RNA polymerase sigma-70 factor [Mucilaginibacter limnophilus]RVU02868.1 RNA polymerase sigma-70 factor [Mucilaginibacter limnophilus]